MSYCTLAELKRYLNISSATGAEDDLLQQMLDEASSAIDAKLGRKFAAFSDTVRKYDPTQDIVQSYLYLDADLAYLTSVTDGDSVDITASVVTEPRNDGPYYALKIKSDQPYYWTYDSAHENAIEVTGRWAYMQKATISAISRSSNIVTATVDSDVTLGSVVSVVGCADATFNGTFTVTAANGASLSWAQTAANDTDTTAYLLYTPSIIVKACRRLAAWLYRQKDTQQSGLSTPMMSPDGSMLMPSTLPQDVLDLIRPYAKKVWR